MSLPLDLADLSLKVASVTSATLTPATLILVLVVIVYTWLTRLRGTPFTLKGPLMRRRPDSSCLRKTTLLPRYLPEVRMRALPASMPLRSLGAPALFLRG